MLGTEAPLAPRPGTEEMCRHGVDFPGRLLRKKKPAEGKGKGKEEERKRRGDFERHLDILQTFDDINTIIQMFSSLGTLNNTCRAAAKVRHFFPEWSKKMADSHIWLRYCVDFPIVMALGGSTAGQPASAPDAGRSSAKRCSNDSFYPLAIWPNGCHIP